MTWHTAKYGDPYSKFVLCIYPLKCTHSSEHTHTHTHTPWTHTRSSGQQFLLQCPASSWGFGVLLKSTLSWYWRWRERWTFTPRHLQSLPDLRLKLTTFWLWIRLSTIRPRLPPIYIYIYIYIIFYRPIYIYIYIYIYAHIYLFNILVICY